MSKKLLITSGIILGLLIPGAFFILQKNTVNNIVVNNPLTGTIISQQGTATTILPSPTPMPFREMTIPYLREKKFSSTLGALQQVNRNAQYTAYVTNYESDGLTINGLLTQPTGEQPEGGWPAIVFIHGYIPPTIYQTNGAAYSAYVDYLARQGFVVFKIDLRGHGNSEGEAGGSYFSSDYIIDTLNAYSALQNSEFVNPGKIGLWGHSMAGNVSLRAMAAKPDIPAIVIWGGAVYSYTDREKYGIDDNSYRPPSDESDRQRRRRELYAVHEEFDPDSPFWKQVTPTNYLNDIKGAIQLHHAINDDVVNIGYSRDLKQLLEQNSIEHELHEYSSGGHNITGGAFNTAMQRTTQFFKKHL